MADQNLRIDIREFKLDLHSTDIAEAKRVVRRRIDECHRYGIRVLKVVYGTPDNFERSIAKAVHQIVRSHELVATEMLPTYVFSDTEPEHLNPELRVYLRLNLSPEVISTTTSFKEFTPKHEKDISKRLRCRTPYYPLKTSYSIEWAARAISCVSHGCTPEQLSAIVETPPIAKLRDISGLLTWEAICLAAKRLSGLKKARKRVNIQNSSAIQREEDARPVFTPITAENTQQRLQRLLAEAKQMALDSKYEDAEQRLSTLISGSDTPPQTLEYALLELGRVHIAMNRPEAEGILRKCFEMTNQRLGRGQHLLPIVSALADFYVDSGDYESYQQLAKDNSDLDVEVAIEERLWGIVKNAIIESSAGQHLKSIETLRYFSYKKGNNSISATLDAYRYDLLGMNYSATGELFLAELALRCALRCCESEKRESEDLRARIFMHQGIVCRRRGRYDDALSAYAEAANLITHQKESNSILFADLMSSSGVVYRQLDNLPSADQCFEKATDIYKRETRTETPEYATILSNYAALRIGQKRYDEAETFLNQARDLLELKSSGDVRARVIVHLHRGELFSAKGDLDLCQVALEEAVQLSQTQLGNESVTLATAKEALGDCLFRRGESARAARLYGEALDVFERIEGPSSLRSRVIRERLRSALKACEGRAS